MESFDFQNPLFTLSIINYSDFDQVSDKVRFITFYALVGLTLPWAIRYQQSR